MNINLDMHLLRPDSEDTSATETALCKGALACRSMGCNEVSSGECVKTLKNTHKVGTEHCDAYYIASPSGIMEMQPVFPANAESGNAKPTEMEKKGFDEMNNYPSGNKRMAGEERQGESRMKENFTYGCMSNSSCSVQRENNPKRKGVRTLIAWIAGRRETEVLESIDEYIESMYASMAGRNASERINGLESEIPRKPSQQPCGEGNMFNRKLTDATETFRRGYSGGMHTRTLQRTGEAFLVPCGNAWSKSNHITGNTGKLAEDEKVADGFVIAMKRGNSRGAKEPCCCNSSNKTGGRTE